ncbi:agamous-like MADS-box protein AGL92 [Solanum dulcamara]|uniref:agamous-like MADS-box protein AGL92 n=1 Tax=Solanum dulcamara TaxID=45834 RepID=UPI002485CE9B|nr:agamous-like MADS-box protein AGL92 [Solanum dulcamara]
MTKKGVKSTRNLDPKMKKAVLDKKLESLFKQANDLSILCDIELGLVVFSPGENNIFAWPSVTQAKEIVRKYLAAIQKSNSVKLVRHDNYLQPIVDNQAEHIAKIEKIAEEKEMESLFNQLIGARIRFDELDVREIKGLLKLFGVRRAKLEERKKQLNENVGNEIDPNDNNDG